MPASLIEQLNREQVVRLVLDNLRAAEIDDWGLAYEIVRALSHWDGLPAEDMAARQAFLSTLAMGADY